MARSIRALILYVKRLWVFLFGQWSWQPPRWFAGLDAAGATVWRQTFGRIARWGGRHPLGFKISILLTLLAVFGGFKAWEWYESRPVPKRIAFTGTSPAATPLTDDAKPEPVQITFSESVARLEDVGKKLTHGITLEPAIQGDWQWQNDRQLSFEPKSDWPVGETFTVKFAKDLFPSHVLLEKYAYEFSSAPFTLSLNQSEFYTDPKDPKIKKVVATVVASHPIDAESLRAAVVMRPKKLVKGVFKILDETIPVKISFNETKGEAYLHSETLTIPLESYDVVIDVKNGVRSARGGPATEDTISAEVRVPGMYDYFRIDQVSPTFVRNEKYEPEQVLIIETSARAKQEEIQKNLKAYVLPKDRPATATEPVRENYAWWDAAEISPDILKLATPVELTAIPTAEEWATTHSFRYKGEIGRYLFVKIEKGIKSYGDFVLAKTFDGIYRIPELPKELTIMHDGAILSLTGAKRLSVQARDVEHVRFELARVLPREVNHLVTQTQGDFRRPYFRYGSFTKDDFTEQVEKIQALPSLEQGKTQYTSFDFGEHLSADKKGLFFLRAESWDVANNVSTGLSDERFVLVTDLGLVVKTARGGAKSVYVVSLRTGRPVAGARVAVLARNGARLVERTTDGAGLATFPALTDFKREKEPVVVIAEEGQDFSFLPYQGRDRQINYSRFDVGGEYTVDGDGRLQAFVFSDRGIYRPGETITAGLIVKATDWAKNLSGIPLEVALTDPRGLVIAKEPLELDDMGLSDITFATNAASLTGDYQISIYVIDEDLKKRDWIGQTNVRVEEFVPDRMRIESRFVPAKEKGWVAPGELKAEVSLQNLFGTPANDRRVAAQMALNPWWPSFDEYRDYQFADPSRARNSFNEPLDDTTTDDEGIATVSLDLERFADATYFLSLVTEGYEAESGRSVTSQIGILVSPNAYLVGFKPDGDLAYVNLNAERAVELIAVDPSLTKIAAADLKLIRYERRYVSALVKQANGTYKYESVEKEITLDETAFRIDASGTRLKLATEQSGDFAYVVKDGQDRELARVRYSVVGRANLTRSLEKNAELQVKLERSDYSPGDTIRLEIKAPYTGAGLVTIEREQVFAHHWFKTDTTNTMTEITLPSGIEGNAYVNVTFVRDINSPEIFMSPLSYAAVPFSISRARRENQVTLTHPEIVKPGDELKVSYQTKEPAKIVVYGVDEGILQVAGYQTPEPLSFFFKKRALEVTTAQILDLLLPEYELVKKLSAPGGDYEDAALAANLNPFKRKTLKPAVFWSGIIDAGPDAREYSYTVPDHFNGRMRLMAIAVNRSTIGVTETAVTVRGPFVINPNVPTFVTPGDEVIVSASVTNAREGSGPNAKIQLTLAPSEAFEILGDATSEQVIAEGREGSFKFKLRVKEKLGSTPLTFTARSGDISLRYRIETSVRPAAPYVTRLAQGHMSDDKTKVPVTRELYPEYRELEASASILPLGLSRGLFAFLANYPYGCTEQLVSKAFPVVALKDRGEFAFSREEGERYFADTLSVLRARQNQEGAFGYWAANSHVIPFQVAYATHFLIEAKERGFAIPADVLEQALTYLKSLLSYVPASEGDARTHAYAIYLLTRSGVVTTKEIDGLLAQLDQKFAETWQTDLTAGYLAASLKLLKREREADRLNDRLELGGEAKPDYAAFYDSLIRGTQLLYLKALHFPDDVRELDGKVLQQVLAPLMNASYNTVSSAYAILALDRYATLVSKEKLVAIKATEWLEGDKSRPLPLDGGLFPKASFTPEANALSFAAEGSAPVFYQVRETGFDRTDPKEEIKAGIEVVREVMDESGKVVTSVPLGKDAFVHVKIRAIDGRSYTNVAIVDLLPAGFEVQISRGSARGGTGGPVWDSPISTDQSSFAPEYVDQREDRLLIFGSVTPDMREFIYKVRATNVGQYRVPPVYAEAMYDPAVKARGLATRLSVEGND